MLSRVAKHVTCRAAMSISSDVAAPPADGVVDSMGNVWSVSPDGSVAVAAGAMSPSPARPATQVRPPPDWSPGEAGLACDGAGYMWLTNGSQHWRADPRTGGALAFGSAGQPTAAHASYQLNYMAMPMQNTGRPFAFGRDLQAQ